MSDSADELAIESRLLFDAVRAPFALLQDTFEFLDVNKAFETMFGFRRHDLVGKSSLTIYDPETVADVRRDRIRLRENPGETLTRERRIFTQSGQLTNAVVRVSSVASRSGQLIYTLLFEEIHQSTDRERMLYSRAEMFKVMIEQSPVPISIQDQHYRLVLVNRAYCELIGYAEHELLGLDPLDFLHPPESREKIRYQRDKVEGANLDALPRISVVRELLHRDGRRILYRLEFGPSRGIDGAPLWCAMLIDLTKQKEVQVELRAQLDHGNRLKNRFDTFAMLTSDAVLVTDRESGRVVFANEAVLDVLGVERRDVAGKPVDNIWLATNPDDRRKVVEMIRNPPHDGHSELLIQVDHDQVGPLSIRLRIFSFGQANSECILLAEDVTDSLRRERQRIADAIEQRDVFVREIHHRINNSLHALIGLVGQHARERPDLKDPLEAITAQISAIAEIHGLQFARDEKVDPTHLARSVANGLSRIFGFNLKLTETRHAAANQWAVSDSEAVPLALIINELITNAWKHARVRAELSIEIMSTADSATIRILNSGLLSKDFDLNLHRGRFRGLGLVNSLTPKRGLGVSIENHADGVLTPQASTLAETTSNNLTRQPIGKRLYVV